MKKTLLLSTLSLSLLSGMAQAYETPATNALLMDATTGYIMYEKDADRPMPPASMSKLMTVYLLFDNLQRCKISMDDEFIVSENAWKKGGTKSGGSTMFLNPGSRVKVGDLLRGIIVQSGNDACIVAAENLAGTEEAFAEVMTETAKELGMENSTFANSTGLPDEKQMMSAKDLAKLAQVLMNKFPEYYSIFAEREFTYNGIRQENRNPLLNAIPGADGLKTGHTEASGFGLTGSVKTHDGRHLVMVINGLKSMKDRRIESEKLMVWGVNGFENTTVVKKGVVIEAIPVWLGEEKTVNAVAQEDYMITTQKARKVDMPEMKISYDAPLQAPIQKGTKIATLEIVLPTGEVKRQDLVAEKDVAKVGYFGRLKQVLFSLF